MKLLSIIALAVLAFAQQSIVAEGQPSSATSARWDDSVEESYNVGLVGDKRGPQTSWEARYNVQRRQLQEDGHHSPDRPVPKPPEYISPVTNAVSPRIYIYDLPRKFTDGCFWGFGCERFRNRVRDSRYHTTDGDNADYYLIPHKEPIPQDLIIEMFDYIRHTWPFFNATKAKRQARHMMILECEHGPGDCSFDRPLRMNKPGSKLPDDINPANPERNVMFLTLNGVADMFNRHGQTAHDCLDCFERSKDIQLVTHNNHLCGPLCGFTLERLRELSPFSAFEANGQLRARPADPIGTGRDLTVFFSGQAAVRDLNDLSGRYQLLYYHKDRPGWAIFDTYEAPPEMRGVHRPHTKVDYAHYMRRSVFCASPLGKYAGDPDRYVPAILLGCIPIVFGATDRWEIANPFDEHPEMKWGDFSVQVKNEDIKNLHETLAAISPERVAAMQAAIERIWPRFVYSSIYGSYMGEDGTRDAFDALMGVLRQRLGH
eukprot:jgi/Mesvir1/14012/Mv21628-RA.1